MTREAVLALIQQRNEAWQRRDAAGLVAGYAENATFESPMQGRVTGRDNIQPIYYAWINAFSDITFTPGELLIEGNRAVQFFTLSGTQSAPFAGVSPTGRRMQITGARIFTFDEDGQITYDRGVYDLTALMVQLGVLKTKAGNT